MTENDGFQRELVAMVQACESPQELLSAVEFLLRKAPVQSRGQLGVEIMSALGEEVFRLRTKS